MGFYVVYNTPGGQYSVIYKNLLNVGHLLIAGSQGSGKSTVITSLIHTAILDSPIAVGFVLIDTKRVSMFEYKNLPHTIFYATEQNQISDVLRSVVSLMESRFKQMEKRRIKEYDGSRIYVIIDDLADLMTTNKRLYSPYIQQIAQGGRAAHITIIAATQSTLRTVIDTSIKVNFTSRLALRTATKQDSRNIIEVVGAETLPDPKNTGKAYGILRVGADTNCYVLPCYEDSERQRLIDFWKKNGKPKHHFSLFRKKYS